MLVNQLVFLLAISSGFLNCIIQAAPNKVGQACVRDIDCGTNEICASNVTNISPSCQQRACQCKPCHMFDTTLTCRSILGLNLGATCLAGSNEVYPNGARCNGTRVVCSDGYIQRGYSCSWFGTLQYGERCNYARECVSPTMLCTFCKNTLDCIGYTCQCDVGHIWDVDRQACRKRAYGDPCSDQSDCFALGVPDYWHGYTWHGMCVGGICTCGWNTAVKTSYLNPLNGSLIPVTLCVSSDSAVNVTVGKSCTLDPIKDNQSASVCTPTTACYACPEDRRRKDGVGICRQITSPFTVLPQTAATPLTVQAVQLVSCYSGHG